MSGNDNADIASLSEAIEGEEQIQNKKLDYFKKLTQDSDGKEKIPKIIASLNYECFNKGEHIIHFGEIGDKFYILLSGTVSIYKPSPKNM